jgi:hypothetical protein
MLRGSNVTIKKPKNIAVSSKKLIHNSATSSIVKDSMNQLIWVNQFDLVCILSRDTPEHPHLRIGISAGTRDAHVNTSFLQT